MNVRQYPTTDLARHITRVMTLDDFLVLPYEERTTKKYITQNEIAKMMNTSRSAVSYLVKVGVFIPRYIVNTERGGLVMKWFNLDDVRWAFLLHRKRDYEGLYRHWESVVARYIPF